MIPKDDHKKENPPGSGRYDVGVHPGLFEVPVFNIPTLDPYIYEPMGYVDLTINQQVFIRSHDGTGQYCYATVTAKQHVGEKCWRYTLMQVEQQLSLL
jgi:hypothetical protein